MEGGAGRKGEIVLDRGVAVPPPGATSGWPSRSEDAALVARRATPPSPHCGDRGPTRMPRCSACSTPGLADGAGALGLARPEPSAAGVDWLSASVVVARWATACRLISERRRFASTRRTCDPLVGLVGRRVGVHPQPLGQSLGQALERQLAVARLRARLRRTPPAPPARSAQQAGPLTRAERGGTGHVELHLDPAEVRLACWPPGPPEVVARQVISLMGMDNPLCTRSVVPGPGGGPVSRRYRGHGSGRPPRPERTTTGYSPPPWTIATSENQACSSRPRRTATGSRTAARSRRTRPWPASRHRSMRASPPSTRPTSTPWAGPSRCWDGPSRACAATRSRSSPRSTGPPGPTPTTAGCRASTSSSRCTRRSSGSRPTTSTCSRPTATTTPPRSRRRCAPSTTWCARARCTTSASRNGRPSRSPTPCTWPTRWASTASSPTSPSTR